MSAFWVICTRCGQQSIAGVVGSVPFPPHVCPKLRDLSPLGGGPNVPGLARAGGAEGDTDAA